jgi:hypothetical protein
MSDIAPGEGFISTEPNLEDVFFGSIRNSQASVSA